MALLELDAQLLVPSSLASSVRHPDAFSAETVQWRAERRATTEQD